MRRGGGPLARDMRACQNRVFGRSRRPWLRVERRRSMAVYLQADRPMTITTPLGADDLLLAGFQGNEAISELFEFQLDLIAENSTPIPFERLLGQRVTIHLALESGKRRHFSGICKRIGQG